MLPLRANLRFMFKTIILFSGMIMVNHRCETSGANVAHRPKNTLFVRNKRPSPEHAFSSDALYEGGKVKLCFIRDKGRCCGTEFDYKFKISRRNGCNWGAETGALYKQDIVVLTEPSDFCPHIETESNETGFLHRVHKSFNTSVQNIRLTEGKPEFKQTPRDKGLNGVNIDSAAVSNEVWATIDVENHCEFQPDIYITIPPMNSSETTSSKQAANLLQGVGSLLEQMGNSSTAALAAGDVKGIITKLTSKSPTKLSFNRDTSGNLSIVQGNRSLEAAFSQTIEIPEEASAMALARNSSFAAVLFFPGKELGDPSSTFLHNQVVGIEMGARIVNLSEPIRIQFNGMEKNGSSFTCSSWDGEGGAPVWVTDGCETQEANSSITCLCTHLTFFAILLSPAPAELSASDLKSLSIITSIGCGLSLFFQVVAFCMHCLIRKQKSSLEAHILIQLFIAMFTMNLSFLMNETIAGLGHVAACVTAAAILHYSLLATFTWFFMQALHLYFSLWRTHSEIKHYMTKISIAGWVTPGVAVTVLLILHKYELLRIYADDGEHVTMCWITDAAVHQGVNVGYYGVVFIFTFSIFVIIVRQIALLNSAVLLDHDKSLTKMKAFSVLALFLLFGLTWAFAFFSHGPLMLPFYYIFTVLNTFQGFFLFIYYYKSSRLFGDNVNQSSSFSSTATAQTDGDITVNVYANQSAKPSWSKEYPVKTAKTSPDRPGTGPSSNNQ